jgi:hypothetical protein
MLYALSNLRDPQGSVGLGKNLDNRRADGAKLAATVRCHAMSSLARTTGLLPVASRETLEEGRHLLV